MLIRITSYNELPESCSAVSAAKPAAWADRIASAAASAETQVAETDSWAGPAAGSSAEQRGGEAAEAEASAGVWPEVSAEASAGVLAGVWAEVPDA